MATANTTSGPYSLYAYVRHGQVLRFNVTSRVSFKHIYQRRPNEARYAVAGHYSVAVHGDEFFVWDLFHVLKDPGTNELIEPKPRLMHGDLDAAIMATLLMYEGEAP